MENQPKLNSNKDVIAFLAERFPLCFTAEGETKPLKIGIFQDIVSQIQGKENISKTQLRSALRLYTSSWRYLYGIKLGLQRVDLDGHPCGKLEVQHVEYAYKKLKKSQVRAQLQRAVQQIKKRENSETTSPRYLTISKQPTKGNSITYSKPRSKRGHPALGLSWSPAVFKTAAVADISTLQIGQMIKIKAGKNIMDATVMQIAKEGVRVCLSSGVALIVRAEHLQF